MTVQEKSDVVILGSTGFIGCHVLTAALTAGIPSTGAARKPGGRSAAKLNLRDVDSLIRVLKSATTAIHCVSYVGTDPKLAADTNIEGTRAILRASELAGVTQVLYVSTAAVTGSGPHSGTNHRSTPYAPESEASRTRAEAERLVLDHGGAVVRPNFVYGPGDGWFLPTLARLLQSDQISRDNLRALVSTIHVKDLAAALVDLSQRHDIFGNGVVMHANALAPDHMSDICDVIMSSVLQTAASPGLTRSSTVENKGPGSGSPLALSPHQLNMLTVDNWFDSSDLWRSIDRPPAKNFRLGRDDVAFYRERFDT